VNDEEGGNHGTIGDIIDPALCLSYRKHMETKIENIVDKISFTVKITGAIIALALAVLQLALHYLG